MTLISIVLGLGVGLLVGILGIGGGIVLVPALTLLLGFDQHTAQGTSLSSCNCRRSVWAL